MLTATQPIILCLTDSDAMATVKTVSRLIVDSAMETQLKDAEGNLQWTDKEKSKPAYPTEMEVFAILAEMAMLFPVLEDNFQIVKRDGKGIATDSDKTVEFVSFNETGHGCRVDWLRNAFRKLAGVHRPGEAAKPWIEVFSGNRGKSRGRKVATTATGSKVGFGDLKAKMAKIEKEAKAEAIAAKKADKK